MRGQRDARESQRDTQFFEALKQTAHPPPVTPTMLAQPTASLAWFIVSSWFAPHYTCCTA
jgi:hypothetical protein